MSKPFLGFALAFSVFMLLLNLTGSQTKPGVILLWLVIGGASAYKLFGAASQSR